MNLQGNKNKLPCTTFIGSHAEQDAGNVAPLAVNTPFTKGLFDVLYYQYIIPAKE